MGDGIILSEGEMIINKDLQTDFDSPERFSQDKIEEQRKKYINSNLLKEVLENYPEVVLVLNEHRQIIGFNQNALELFDLKEEEILGRRFGETINCIHFHENEGLCGTSIFCKECGAAQAIKYTNKNEKSVSQECRISVDSSGCEEAYDFKVRTTKIDIEDEKFILFSIKDISDEKRRHALEKIFFHDVLNTGSAINGLANMINEEEEIEEIKPLSNALVDSSEQLMSEIQAQKDLTFAEKGILEVRLVSASVNEILKKISELYSKHSLLRTNKLKVNYLKSDFFIKTDPVLLIRSIGNLTKNAIEASTENQTIEVSVEGSPKEVIFNVKNPQVIPERIQLQIFKRSFSTKSKTGRGIGTYSVKLLIEQYIGGKVYFVSNELDKTIFSIKLTTKIV